MGEGPLHMLNNTVPKLEVSIVKSWQETFGTVKTTKWAQKRRHKAGVE